LGGANTRLNIIDIGGKIDEKNDLIMAEATHAVILSNDPALFQDWKNCCEKLNLPIIAMINSDYDGKADYIEQETPLLTGTIHYLERGEVVSQRPMVQALAGVILNLLK
jgi:CRISPR-associated protein Csx3